MSGVVEERYRSADPDRSACWWSTTISTCARSCATSCVNIGVKDVHEASDGIAGLEAIRTVAPDVVILDWEMPLLNGAELVRIVRSPGVFPMPDVPIIMLTGHGERWRVVEAARLGVNEFLSKPVSAKALLDRMVAILTKPRADGAARRLLRPGAAQDFCEPVREPTPRRRRRRSAERPG